MCLKSWIPKIDLFTKKTSGETIPLATRCQGWRGTQSHLDLPSLQHQCVSHRRRTVGGSTGGGTLVVFACSPHSIAMFPLNSTKPTTNWAVFKTYSVSHQKSHICSTFFDYIPCVTIGILSGYDMMVYNGTYYHNIFIIIGTYILY